MNHKERFEAALKLEPVDRVPAACPLQTGTIALMEASGAYWPDAHLEADRMARLALAAHEVAGIESVRVPFHNDYEAEAMGCVLGGWRRDGPPIKKELRVRSLEDIDSLSVPDPRTDGRMPIVLEAIGALSRKVGGELPVIAAMCAPFELAVRIRGMTDIMRDIMLRPEALKALMRVTMETAIEYGRALGEAGASTIALIDGSASTLGLQFYPEYPSKFTRTAVQGLEMMTVLHVCGDTSSILSAMADTGVNGLSIESVVDISFAKETVGERVAIVGNVSPTDTLWCGTPERVEREARECIAKGVDVLAPGCGFSPLTPLENMRALSRSALAG